MPRQIFPRPRVYVCGFPKSGLHLAALMVEAVLKPQAKDNWFGTVAQGWTTRAVNVDAEHVLKKIGHGRYFKGHTAHTPELENLFRGYGVVIGLVYRDLRDVAISQTHHIMTVEFNPDGKERFMHPGRDKYLALGGFDEILLAVIEGLDEYAGLVERWEQFAPWLDVPEVFPLQFEDMRRKPHNVANGFLSHLINMSLVAGGATEAQMNRMEYPGNEFAKNTMNMATMMGRKHRSATFRKGNIGDWRKEFTPAAVDAFKRTGGAEWLIELGYEEHDRWRL